MVGLTAVTVLALCVVMGKSVGKEVAVLFWAHAGLSFTLYYGTQKYPKADKLLSLPADLFTKKQSAFSGDNRKKIAILFGVASQTAMALTLLSSISTRTSLLSLLSFSLLHFYFMEADDSGKPGVRPAGLVGFAVPLLALVMVYFK